MLTTDLLRALRFAPDPLSPAACNAENVNRRSNIIPLLIDLHLNEPFNSNDGLNSRQKIHTAFLPGEIRDCIGLPNGQMSACVSCFLADLCLTGSYRKHP